MYLWMYPSHQQGTFLGSVSVSICAICGETKCFYAKSKKKVRPSFAHVSCWQGWRFREGELIQFDCQWTCLSSVSFGVPERQIGFIQDDFYYAMRVNFSSGRGVERSRADAGVGGQLGGGKDCRSQRRGLACCAPDIFHCPPLPPFHHVLQTVNMDPSLV